MLTKAQQNAISSDFDKGNDIYLRIETGRYKGSVCLLTDIRTYPSWRYTPSDRMSYKYILNAQGLIRKLSINPKNLSETYGYKTHLTTKPIVNKPQASPRDFSNTPIDVNDHLFGNGKLIKVTAILPNNYVESRCIKSSKKKNNDKISTHRSLKSFIKIEDPTQILLRI